MQTTVDQDARAAVFVRSTDVLTGEPDAALRRGNPERLRRPAVIRNLNCHSFQTMDFPKQRQNASQQMQKAMAERQTCIDCHKGTAHKLPDMTSGFRTLFRELQASGEKLSPKVSDSVYTLLISPLYLARPAAADAANDGRLLAASAMRVLAREGDFLQVRIFGWQQAGAGRIIHALQGKRIS